MGTPDKRTRRSRNKLGRGLSALVDPPAAKKSLLPDTAVGIDLQDSGSGSPGRDSVIEVQLGDVYPNKHQPREVFDEEALESLAASIGESGLMQPIVVRARVAGGFEIIAGERRWRACGMAGLETVPAIVRVVDDQQSAQWALIENIQREDLNAIEKARGYQRLSDQFGLTQQEIGTRVGVSRASVANMIRLLDLDTDLQAMVMDGRLSTGHAKALLQCPDLIQRTKLATKVVSEGWTVRALERAASKGLSGSGQSGEAEQNDTKNRVDSVLADLEQQLGQHLGTKVRLRTDRAGTKGRIEVDFYDLDHFDGLMEKIGFLPSET